MDVIGSAVIVIPVVGELVWAPVSALIFWRMFGFHKGFLGGILEFSLDFKFFKIFFLKCGFFAY